MADIVITWTSTNTTVGTTSPVSATTSTDGTATTTFTSLVMGATNIIARNDTVYDQAAVTILPNIFWNMTISATNQLELVAIGMHPNATDGIDEFDTLITMPLRGKVIMAINDTFATSIMKTRCYNVPITWNLSVGVPEGQTTTLNWEVPLIVNLTIAKECGQVIESGSELSAGSHQLLITAKLLPYVSATLQLNAGWNMVSIPIIPNNNTVEAIFGCISTLNDKPIVTWESPQFVTVDIISPNIGYWVFTPTDTEINLIGKKIENKTLNLNAGWNMVSTNGLESLDIEKIPNQIVGRPAVSWKSPSFVETNVIEPGKSAWVFVTKETIVG